MVFLFEFFHLEEFRAIAEFFAVLTLDVILPYELQTFSYDP